MPNRYKAALHLHTTYSDGELSLEALKAHFQKRGFDCLIMSDHAEAMDGEKMEEYVARCRALSDARFCVVPGLEFAYRFDAGSLHLLGYGVHRYQREETPAAMMKTIQQLGGLAVLAHPYPPLAPQIAPLQEGLDGIELWNTKYNGRWAPALWNYRLLKGVREKRPEVLGFYGTDFHWQTQYTGMAILIEAEGLTPEALLTGLRKGRFYAEKEGMRLSPEGRLTPGEEARFERRERLYHLWRKMVVGARAPFKALRLPIPRRLKAMARKVL
ncbi:MAG: hypothetical protein HY282_02015 [Nitrospirae bacterium]|nr:hypothetical protein [Candidatus Manganitrophaceae bacterium]